MKYCKRINARATRRAGELLKQIEPQKNQHSAGSGGGPSRKQAAHNAGLSNRQRKDALRIASIPGDDFDEQVEGNNPPSVTKLADKGTEHRDQDEDREAARKMVAAMKAYAKALSGIDVDALASIRHNEG